MKILDLQPADILVTVELRLKELRGIVDALDKVTINTDCPEDYQNAEQLKKFASMLGAFLDEFDHGTGPNRPRI